MTSAAQREANRAYMRRQRSRAAFLEAAALARAAAYARVLLLDQLAGAHRDHHDLCSESTGFSTPVDKPGSMVQGLAMPSPRLEEAQAARERGA